MQRFGTGNFKRFSNLIYQQYGIYYNATKQDILQTKLKKLMSSYNMTSYDECYENLKMTGNNLLHSDFASEITVNYTSFFRESAHFDYIRENADMLYTNRADKNRSNVIRAWSAACSTGEEPYTLAMVLHEALSREADVKILATDISKKVLAIAQQGLYSPQIYNEVESSYLGKYFYKTPEGYTMSEDIKKLVSFRHFNLMNSFPFKNTFDLVFCRNVMIYFDAAVRQDLVNRIYEILRPGGLLFIGHSESLSGQVHKFRYVQPAVYTKN